MRITVGRVLNPVEHQINYIIRNMPTFLFMWEMYQFFFFLLLSLFTQIQMNLNWVFAFVLLLAALLISHN